MTLPQGLKFILASVFLGQVSFLSLAAAEQASILPVSYCSNGPTMLQFFPSSSAALYCNGMEELTVELQTGDAGSVIVEYVEISCASGTETILFEVTSLNGVRIDETRTEMVQLPRVFPPGAECMMACAYDSQGTREYFNLDDISSKCTIPALPPNVTDVTVVEGDELNLTCINSNPSQSGVSQEWRDSEGMFLSNKSSLLVESVTRSFSGAYTCVLTGVNNYTLGDTVNVTVEYAPEVSTSDPTSRNVSVGGTAVLSCDYDGVPTPTVRWLHNGDELVNGTENVHIVDLDGISTLTLSNFGEDSGGVYTCVASNSLGSNNSTAFTLVAITTMPTTDPGSTTIISDGDNLIENILLPVLMVLVILGLVVAALVILVVVKKHHSRKYDRYHFHFHFHDELDPNFEPIELNETIKLSRSVETIIISRSFSEENLKSDLEDKWDDSSSVNTQPLEDTLLMSEDATSLPSASEYEDTSNLKKGISSTTVSESIATETGDRVTTENEEQPTKVTDLSSPKTNTIRLDYVGIEEYRGETSESYLDDSTLWPQSDIQKIELSEKESTQTDILHSVGGITLDDNSPHHSKSEYVQVHSMVDSSLDSKVVSTSGYITGDTLIPVRELPPEYQDNTDLHLENGDMESLHVDIYSQPSETSDQDRVEFPSPTTSTTDGYVHELQPITEEHSDHHLKCLDHSDARSSVSGYNSDSESCLQDDPHSTYQRSESYLDNTIATPPSHSVFTSSSTTMLLQNGGTVSQYVPNESVGSSGYYGSVAGMDYRMISEHYGSSHDLLSDVIDEMDDTDLEIHSRPNERNTEGLNFNDSPAAVDGYVHPPSEEFVGHDNTLTNEQNRTDNSHLHTPHNLCFDGEEVHLDGQSSVSPPGSHSPYVVLPEQHDPLSSYLPGALDSRVQDAAGEVLPLDIAAETAFYQEPLKTHSTDRQHSTSSGDGYVHEQQSPHQEPRWLDSKSERVSGELPEAATNFNTLQLTMNENTHQPTGSQHLNISSDGYVHEPPVNKAPPHELKGVNPTSFQHTSPDYLERPIVKNVGKISAVDSPVCFDFPTTNQLEVPTAKQPITNEKDSTKSVGVSFLDSRAHHLPHSFPAEGTGSPYIDSGYSTSYSGHGSSYAHEDVHLDLDLSEPNPLCPKTSNSISTGYVQYGESY